MIFSVKRILISLALILMTGASDMRILFTEKII